MENNIQKHKQMVASRIWGTTTNVKDLSQPLVKSEVDATKESEDVIHDDVTWEDKASLRKSYDALGLETELQELSNAIENSEEIEKSHVANEFVYGSNGMEFSKKGSELKAMAQVKKASCESKVNAMKQQKAELKAELEEQGVKFHESEYGDRPSYDHNQVQDETRAKIYKYEDICYSVKSAMEDCNVLDTIIDNVEDNKSYKLTIRQLASLK